MAILESVRKLAEKLGAETNGRDIADQLNKINKHLDETALGGRDIAEAVSKFADVDSGGVEFNKINVFVPQDSFLVDVINNTDSTIVETKFEYSHCTFVNPLKKFTCGESAGLKIVFTPADDYDGFYKRIGGKISFSGATVKPGDGYVYEAAINFMGNTYTMTKLYNAKGILITIE